MRDAIKTLYDHWSNVHPTSPEEHAAFEQMHELLGEQIVRDPLYGAIIDYSVVIQYEAFREGVLTAFTLLHPLPEQWDNNI